MRNGTKERPEASRENTKYWSSVSSIRAHDITMLVPMGLGSSVSAVLDVCNANDLCFGLVLLIAFLGRYLKFLVSLTSWGPS
jgi:hypothetical protein